MIRGADGRFKAVSWRDALAVVAEVVHQVKPKEIVGVAGKLSDAESMMALKDFLNRMGSNNVWCEGNGPHPNADLRSGYLLNSGISGLEKADVFLLVGTQVIILPPVWLFLDLQIGLYSKLCNNMDYPIIIHLYLAARMHKFQKLI